MLRTVIAGKPLRHQETKDQLQVATRLTNAIEIVATSYPIKTMSLPAPCQKRFRFPLHLVLPATSFLMGPDSKPIPGSKK